MVKRIYIVIACAMLGLVGCENPNYHSSVPSYPVRLDVDIVAEYPHFVPDNGYQTLTFTTKRYANEALGYSGILVWVDMSGKYQAADLCCPHCLLRTTPVTVDGIYAHCPECGEDFDISYGYALPMHGMTQEPLRKYTIYAQGSKIQIRN